MKHIRKFNESWFDKIKGSLGLDWKVVYRDFNSWKETNDNWIISGGMKIRETDTEPDVYERYYEYKILYSKSKNEYKLKSNIYLGPKCPSDRKEEVRKAKEKAYEKLEEFKKNKFGN